MSLIDLQSIIDRVETQFINYTYTAVFPHMDHSNYIWSTLKTVEELQQQKVLYVEKKHWALETNIQHN